MAEDDDETRVRFVQAGETEHGVDAVGHFLLGKAVQQPAGGVA